MRPFIGPVNWIGGTSPCCSPPWLAGSPSGVGAPMRRKLDEDVEMEVLALAWIWFLHAAIAGLLTAPIVWLSSQRVHWEWWELSAFALPFAVWVTLFFSRFSTGKSIANLGEPIILCFAIPTAALIRAAIGAGPSERLWAGTLLAGICGVAVAVFCMVPPLPE
jgi:hypothetical protein